MLTQEFRGNPSKHRGYDVLEPSNAAISLGEGLNTAFEAKHTLQYVSNVRHKITTTINVGEHTASDKPGHPYITCPNTFDSDILDECRTKHEKEVKRGPIGTEPRLISETVGYKKSAEDRLESGEERVEEIATMVADEVIELSNSGSELEKIRGLDLWPLLEKAGFAYQPEIENSSELQKKVEMQRRRYQLQVCKKIELKLNLALLRKLPENSVIRVEIFENASEDPKILCKFNPSLIDPERVVKVGLRL